MEISESLKDKLELVMKVHNISWDEAQEALSWVMQPTIRPIVGIREFLNSPYYMNSVHEDGRPTTYPLVMDELEAMNNGEYSEAVLTGSIGAAKTHCALATTAYQLYILSCYSSPHELYGLDPASEIVFIFQSLNAAAARRVDYERFKAMITNSPYFREYFPFDKDLKSELHFPNRIIVRPVSGAETAAIGQNVFGGIIDEVNFMAVIDGGKNAGQDGTYDQAIALYNSISKRRKSRFGVKGKVPGMLCIVSSRRYPGQFTDIKEAEARAEIAKYGKSQIFVYDKRTWEIKPPGSFMSETFQVFIGDEARRPRILEPGEAYTLLKHPKPGVNYEGLIVSVPMDFIDDFERDVLSSLRDIAGVATLAKHPFIVNRETIQQAMRKDWICFERERVDFEETQLSIIPSQIYKPELPRFFHCDLAISGDSAGFCIGTVIGFKSITTVAGALEMLPVIHIDALLEISPPKGREIKLFKVRDILHTLRKLGLNVKWGTFDQFQCVAGNTSIWSDHGLVDARHIKEGMIVQSRIGPRPVTKVWSFGVQDTICMTTTDHSILEMTPNHKIEVAVDWHWPTIDGKQFKRPIWGWKRADELKVGDVVNTWSRKADVQPASLLRLPSLKRGARNSMSFSMPRWLTEGLAQLLGVIWGDGYIREDEISVTCADGEEQCAAAVFKGAFICDPVVRKVGNHFVVSLCSRDVTRWLRDCGFEKGDFIPEPIRHSPTGVQAAFVRGLFSTDGNVGLNDGACTFSTQHWEWAEYVHVFLRSAFGISSVIVKSARTGDHYPTFNEVQYIVTVRGSRARFSEAVGFCYSRKQEALNKHLDVPGRDLWVRVESLTPSQAEVFDFEVAEDHAYIANGLVSHNSRDSMQLLKQAGLSIGYQSVDVNMAPYDFVKNALYDKRLSLPSHAKCGLELASLEKLVQKNKVDHPPSGCFVGSTQVECSDWISRSMQELVEGYARGEHHSVASWNIELNEVQYLPIKSPRVTMHTTELVEVELDNGQVFRCTPDHRFLLVDGTYKEAQFLTPEDELRG